jgi:hypothetical protein
MRIDEYKSRNGSLDGQVNIHFSESEIGIIDNALFEASKLPIYKEDKDFLEVQNYFHTIREIVNHGFLSNDEILSAAKRIPTFRDYKLKR